MITVINAAVLLSPGISIGEYIFFTHSSLYDLLFWQNYCFVVLTSSCYPNQFCELDTVYYRNAIFKVFFVIFVFYVLFIHAISSKHTTKIKQYI